MKADVEAEARTLREEAASPRVQESPHVFTTIGERPTRFGKARWRIMLPLPSARAQVGLGPLARWTMLAARLGGAYRLGGCLSLNLLPASFLRRPKLNILEYFVFSPWVPNGLVTAT